MSLKVHPLLHLPPARLTERQGAQLSSLLVTSWPGYLATSLSVASDCSARLALGLLPAPRKGLLVGHMDR